MMQNTDSALFKRAPDERHPYDKLHALLRPTVFLRHDHGAGRRRFLAYLLISGGNMYNTDSCCLLLFSIAGICYGVWDRRMG